ncbi:SRPBCC domain-containing protein [uncultured Croceitalea sp.]|uniref:SRPBCC domain-containing protein n=1 Tax=uncultured Croceitalea sp. TaxID=1798908 RepID=UPI0033058BFF
MKANLLSLLFLCFSALAFAQNMDDDSEMRVKSVIDSSKADNMILKQFFVVNVPLDSVWNACTTKKGWENWAVSLAEVDFRINGTIRTNYNKEGEIGDESTITLHIVNYIPKRMLTLQAHLTNNFPEFMREDEKNLFNMILFEEINGKKTKVSSYGIGYKNNEKYMSLMKFFIQGNEQSYLNLISYLETGKPSVDY